MRGKERNNIFSGFLLLLMLVLPLSGIGQDVKANLTCRAKMVEVGRPFEIELSVRHPEHVVIIFPDSAKDFSPYEVHNAKPLPTRTSEGISEDTKIFRLLTWEIDSIQYLEFPVRYLDEKGDTGVVMSNRVSVLFQPKIARYSDSLKVRMVEELQEIAEPFNWTAFLVIGGAILVILILALILLWKPVVRKLRRWRIEREWKIHLSRLQKLKSEMGDPEKYISGLNRTWKRYFDRRNKRALGSATTKDLQRILPKMENILPQDQEKLIELGRASDMILFAGRKPMLSDLDRFHNEVGRIMEHEYKRRKEAVEL